MLPQTSFQLLICGKRYLCIRWHVKPYKWTKNILNQFMQQKSSYMIQETKRKNCEKMCRFSQHRALLTELKCRQQKYPCLHSLPRRFRAGRVRKAPQTLGRSSPDPDPLAAAAVGGGGGAPTPKARGRGERALTAPLHAGQAAVGSWYGAATRRASPAGAVRQCPLWTLARRRSRAARPGDGKS
jgi:hypothetical protein